MNITADDIPPPRFRCDKCGFGTPFREVLKSHVEEVHDSAADEPPIVAAPQAPVAIPAVVEMRTAETASFPSAPMAIPGVAALSPTGSAPMGPMPSVPAIALDGTLLTEARLAIALASALVTRAGNARAAFFLQEAELALGSR